MLDIKYKNHGFSTSILLATSVHFLASREYGNLTEYSESQSLLVTKLVLNMPVFSNGVVKVSDEIGLGISLNSDIIDKYAKNINILS